DRGQRPYLRSISRALTPFFEAHISNITNTQVRTGILVPCITGVGQDAVLLAACPALPEAALALCSRPGLAGLAVPGGQEVGPTLGPAVRADRRAGPAKLLKVGVGGCLVGDSLCDPEDVGL